MRMSSPFESLYRPKFVRLYHANHCTALHDPLQVQAEYYRGPGASWAAIRGLFVRLWCAVLEL